MAEKEKLLAVFNSQITQLRNRGLNGELITNLEEKMETVLEKALSLNQADHELPFVLVVNQKVWPIEKLLRAAAGDKDIFIRHDLKNETILDPQRLDYSPAIYNVGFTNGQGRRPLFLDEIIATILHKPALIGPGLISVSECASEGHQIIITINVSGRFAIRKATKQERDAFRQYIGMRNLYCDLNVLHI